jgi:hypothetical protein
MSKCLILLTINIVLIQPLVIGATDTKLKATNINRVVEAGGKDAEGHQSAMLRWPLQQFLPYTCQVLDLAVNAKKEVIIESTDIKYKKFTPYFHNSTCGHFQMTLHKMSQRDFN